MVCSHDKQFIHMDSVFQFIGLWSLALCDLHTTSVTSGRLLSGNTGIGDMEQGLNPMQRRNTLDSRKERK